MGIEVELDRRNLLLGTVAAIGANAYPASLMANSAMLPAFASAARRNNSSFSIVLLSASGQLLREIPLSARGHDIAVHRATHRAVAFARRPGTFAVAFKTGRPTPPHIFTAQANRHFFGHGAFSHDGRLLYVTENDIPAARGVIGIYDVARNYAKIGEHPSYGLGPHEIIVLQDRQTLVIANGGLDTMPEAGRQNLNLDAMDASLTFVDAQSGALLARHTLTSDLKQLSLRHIAADHQGRVWFGGQWEGDPGAAPGLIGYAGRDTRPEIIDAPIDDSDYLKGYIGSVAMSTDGRIFAASAPKAGRIVYLDTQTQSIISESILKDACGLAGETPSTFAASSGFGDLRHETSASQVISQTQLADIAFDNHLRRLS
jgi:hypothetical protein